MKTVINNEPINIEGQFDPAMDKTTLLKELIKTGQFERANQFLDAYKKKEDLLRKDRTSEFAMERYLQNLNPFSRMAPLADTIPREKQTEEATPINLVRENIARIQKSKELGLKALEAERQAKVKFFEVLGDFKNRSRQLDIAEAESQRESLTTALKSIVASYDSKIASAEGDDDITRKLEEEKAKAIDNYYDIFLDKAGYRREKRVKKPNGQ